MDIFDEFQKKVNTLKQKIEYASALVADTAWALFDIFTLTEKELTSNTEQKESKKIAKEDQEYLRSLRKRNGKYKINVYRRVSSFI